MNNKRFQRVLLFILFFIILLFGLPRLITAVYARARIFRSEDSPKIAVAIVFGAGLQRDGSPSPVLKDRVATASELYFDGKIQKILMSGDNRFVYYDEPSAMKNYAIELGVPEENIVLDFAGRRTYDTCYRAIKIFGVHKALLITQQYHLPRAIYTCNQLGLDGTGIIADRRNYSRHAYISWIIRELPATLTAIWDVWVLKPVPVLGKPEPIFPSDNAIVQS